MPNVSEGRDRAAIEAIAEAFAGAGARVLDIHADPDHQRAVYTLVGDPGRLAPALLAGAQRAVERIRLPQDPDPARLHPHVGAIDVVPIVYLDPASRGAACAEALVTADLIATDLDLPVLLYGPLAHGRTRHELRRGGPAELARRLAAHELTPDFGPPRAHPTAGATLLAARPPLIAFNLELAPSATAQTAREIAAAIRETGPEGLPGVRAIGLELPSRGHLAQVSTNVERPDAVSLRTLVEAVRRHAPVVAAELVGLAPRASLEDFPEDVPLRGFDPQRHILENALGF